MINPADIESAREHISPFIIETPLQRNRTLSTLLGANVYLKLELLSSDN